MCDSQRNTVRQCGVWCSESGREARPNQVDGGFVGFVSDVWDISRYHGDQLNLLESYKTEKHAGQLHEERWYALRRSAQLQGTELRGRAQREQDALMCPLRH